MTTKDPAVASAGVTITGSTVTTHGGDIVGGSKISISTRQSEDPFCRIAEAIDAASPSSKQLALGKLQDLRAEAAKTSGASDRVVANLIDGIVNLVPEAISSVVSAFAGPILGTIAGPMTKSILGKIQDKAGSDWV